jgi:hypothetical protein
MKGDWNDGLGDRLGATILPSWLFSTCFDPYFFFFRLLLGSGSAMVLRCLSLLLNIFWSYLSTETEVWAFNSLNSRFLSSFVMLMNCSWLRIPTSFIIVLIDSS